MHKRAFGAAAVTGVAALLMSACGGGGSAASPSASTSSASASETTAAAPTPTGTEAPVRDAGADLVIWADADRAPIITKYAEEFGKENGVKVAVQISVDTREQFKDATKVGKGPDVIVGAHDWLGELVQNGTVAPIQLSDDVAGKFSENSIAATKFNGQSYGVPYAVENIGLIRNTDLAPEAPKTMDELVKMGNEAKSKSGGKVTNVLIQPVGKTGNAYFSYPYLSAFDGGIFATKANGDYDANKVIVNSAGSIKGAEVLAKLGKDKVLSTNVGDDNAEGLFTSGKAPFFITGPWAVPNAKKAGIKYEVSSLPSLEGGGADAAVPRRADVLRLGQGQERRPGPGVRHQLRPAQGRPARALRAGWPSPGADRGLRRGRGQGQGRQGVVRGRQGRQAHAQHPGHELGLGPARPGCCRRHLRQAGQGAFRRGSEGDRGEHRQGLMFS